MNKHPYTQYEHSPLWNVINAAIISLAKNQDIKENTAREYIVGYIVKCVNEFQLENRHKTS